jgi:hypothetical protein
VASEGGVAELLSTLLDWRRFLKDDCPSRCDRCGSENRQAGSPTGRPLSYRDMNGHWASLAPAAACASASETHEGRNF